uniref:Cadherin-like protein 26 n=2 Tax=Kryptolebias marmoratus TaxID=37003 RepID=A0A3Q3BFP0_KRYMA
MLLFLLLVHFLSSSTCSELLSRQKRVWIIDSFEIEEENPGPFPYFLGKVDIERQYRIYFDLYGQGVDEEPFDVLSIDKETGKIYVNKPVDYEKTEKLKLRFEAKRRDMTIDTRLGVEIKIRDINDNPPRFNRDLFEITVDEELTQGASLLTVWAHDIDKLDSPNSTFHYNIKSVFPKSPDTEFFVNENGLISFKGCLDYDVANEITVVVEAIDHGDKVQLSSSTTVLIHIEDSNNHLPIITGQTGSGKVKEDEFGTSPLKIHVTDKDSPHSKAWKAKYTIHNDDERNFKIETDPETNDGILTVVKPINYEEKTTRELMISVENEAPYFFCKVKQKTANDLWQIETNKDGKHPGGNDQPVSTNVVIEVEDVNDPPEFEVTVKKAKLHENAPIGTWVSKVTAVDPDFGSGKDFLYKIGEDPAGWMKIDPNTGNITTIQTCDRESPHVVDSVYTLLLHAVDKGDPPMTGTATLHIHLVDENDNLPRPEVEFVDVCMSDGPTTTNISASDADADPYGGPFRFELLGNVEGKWKLDPSYGFTAGLVKELNVQAGFHTLELKISDLQGQYGVYSLNVTVCTCSVTRNCRSRSSPTTAGWGAAGIAFLSLVLLLALLLVAFGLSCNKEHQQMETSQEESLKTYNTETSGTDCKVFLSENIFRHDSSKMQINSKTQYSHYLNQESYLNGRGRWSHSERNNLHATSANWDNTSWNYGATRNYKLNTERESFFARREFVNLRSLSVLVQQSLFSLQSKEEAAALDEYHLYEDEGDFSNLSDVDAIDSPDDSTQSFLKAFESFDPKFMQLASICNPQQE